MNGPLTLQVALIGIIATALLDAWTLALNRLGVRTLPMGLVGRWMGHMCEGRFFHDAIRQATPVRHEAALGWAIHYAVGVVFASALVMTAGVAWLAAPSAGPALLAGALSVVMPLFVMQPAMGAGFASAKTPSPLSNVARSVANHLVLGLGYYVAAVAVPSLTPVH